jgi:hypothetical protein
MTLSCLDRAAKNGDRQFGVRAERAQAAQLQARQARCTAEAHSLLVLYPCASHVRNQTTTLRPLLEFRKVN